MCVQTWLNVLMAVNKGGSFLLNSLILDLDSNDSHLQKEVKYFNCENSQKLFIKFDRLYFIKCRVLAVTQRLRCLYQAGQYFLVHGRNK